MPKGTRRDTTSAPVFSETLMSLVACSRVVSQLGFLRLKFWTKTSNHKLSSISSGLTDPQAAFFA